MSVINLLAHAFYQNLINYNCMELQDAEEIRKEINESLQLGVPIATIAADLKNRGIDIFDFHQQEIEKENEEKSEIELAEDALRKAKGASKWVKIALGIAMILLILASESLLSLTTVLISFAVIIATWYNNSEKVKNAEAHLESLHDDSEEDDVENS
jgi:hypothetical protein